MYDSLYLEQSFGFWRFLRFVTGCTICDRQFTYYAVFTRFTSHNCSVLCVVLLTDMFN